MKPKKQKKTKAKRSEIGIIQHLLWNSWNLLENKMIPWCKHLLITRFSWLLLLYVAFCSEGFISNNVISITNISIFIHFLLNIPLSEISWWEASSIRKIYSAKSTNMVKFPMEIKLSQLPSFHFYSHLSSHYLGSF